VHFSFGGPNWVFLTVCTKDRIRWLAQPSVQGALHEIWLHKATAWLVSDYLLMPDHIHLFCGPYDLGFSIERWIAFWKDRLTRTCADAGSFQRGGFHHRLRDGENYSQKWQYVQENPVRAGLTANVGDWPYKGRVHEIRW
jgi:putative transposase